MDLGSISAGIAAVAALVTVYYARATVIEARKARGEASGAHAEELAREGELIDAIRLAHVEEVADRQLALERELWLQRLTEVGKLQDLLWQASDIARHEVDNPPPRIAGQTGTWTRLTGVLLRVEAALANLQQLGGPALPEIKQMASNGKQIGIHPGEVVSKTMSALEQTIFVANNDESLQPPGRGES